MAETIVLLLLVTLMMMTKNLKSCRVYTIYMMVCVYVITVFVYKLKLFDCFVYSEKRICIA